MVGAQPAQTMAASGTQSISGIVDAGQKPQTVIAFENSDRRFAVDAIQAKQTLVAESVVINPVGPVVSPVFAGGGGGFGRPIPFSWLPERPRPRAISGSARCTGRPSKCEAYGYIGYGGSGGGSEVRSFVLVRADNDTRRRKDERDLIDLILMNVA